MSSGGSRGPGSSRPGGGGDQPLGWAIAPPPSWNWRGRSGTAADRHGVRPDRRQSERSGRRLLHRRIQPIPCPRPPRWSGLDRSEPGPARDMTVFGDTSPASVGAARHFDREQQAHIGDRPGLSVPMPSPWRAAAHRPSPWARGRSQPGRRDRRPGVAERLYAPAAPPPAMSWAVTSISRAWPRTSTPSTSRAISPISPTGRRPPENSPPRGTQRWRAAMIGVGIGGWTFEPWRATFYPEDLQQKDELSYGRPQS